MFNIFARNPVMVTVWCNSADAEREFDSGINSVPQEWLLGVRTCTGGFEDGHATILYPCRRNKVKDIERRIRVFNKYAEHFGVDFEVKRVG